MKRLALAAALLAAAGCGGNGGAPGPARFVAVRPCLRRLALVGSRDPHILTLPTQQVTTVSSESAGVAVPEWIADLAYRGREAESGAGSALLRFYANEDDAQREAADDSIVLGKTVVVWWSSDPTPRQERQLDACLSNER